jgi:nitrate reductase beta subunit
MVWYVPPLSPVMGFVEGEGSEADPDDVFPAIEELRIPIQYLANLLSAGDGEVIRRVLKRLAAMRGYMREKNLSGTGDAGVATSVGMDPQAIEDMYRLLAIAKYEDRYVIPLAHRELVSDELYAQRGTRGLDFTGGHAPAESGARNEAFYAMKDELERKARELGGKIPAPNVQFFKSKKDFEAFHLRKPREA